MGSSPVLAEGGKPHSYSWQALIALKSQMNWGGTGWGVVALPTAEQAGPKKSAPASSLCNREAPHCTIHKQETRVQPFFLGAKEGMKKER